MEKDEIAQAKEMLARKEDLSKWYTNIVELSKLIDKRYHVKGCYVWLPYGYKAMMNIKNIWDTLFQESGIEEMYFPLLVPIDYAKQNDQWFNGFKNEAFWVKGIDEEKANYILRPTGEPAMYPMFSLWTRSKNDLPIRIYETVSSFRYETKHTMPIIRDREITVWHEIHTAHATKEEAEAEAELHIELNDKIWKELALEPLRVNKPLWECFPGAVGAIEYYSLIPNGKAMENGSINKLGQAYAKKFNIKFKDEKGKEDHVWQVCTGNGARLLAGIILIHGDDKGLILPPKIAPIQVVITTVYNKDNNQKVTKKSE
jgi:prolyl-tRNA synthetase